MLKSQESKPLMAEIPDFDEEEFQKEVDRACQELARYKLSEVSHATLLVATCLH